jgi:hypothetical protein
LRKIKNHSNKFGSQYAFKKTISLAFSICTLISGCKLFESSGPSIPDLLAAPEQIEIDGREYILETYLWRDFMPPAPPDGQPLIALIWVTATDSLAFPPTIDANMLWVINDEMGPRYSGRSDSKGYRRRK